MGRFAEELRQLAQVPGLAGHQAQGGRQATEIPRQIGRLTGGGENQPGTLVRFDLGPQAVGNVQQALDGQLAPGLGQVAKGLSLIHI